MSINFGNPAVRAGDQRGDAPMVPPPPINFGRRSQARGGVEAGDQRGDARGVPFGIAGADTQGGRRFGAHSIRPPTIPPDTRATEMQSLINNEEHSDICFEVEGKKVFAHKLILITYSQYFNNMFSSNMQESESGVIQIQDVSMETFMNVLHYLYTGSEALCSTLEEFQRLLVASDKYQLDRLKAICEYSISQRLTVDTVASILLLSSRYNADGLKRYAMDFLLFHWNSQVVKESKSILKEDPDLMLEVIDNAQNHTLVVAPSFFDSA